MKIVFEGPDGAGKSTLAKIVAERLQLPLRGRITRKGPESVYNVNAEDLMAEGDMVLDRCYWLSDMVYEPIYSGKSSVFNIDMGESSMKQADAVLVYVTCSEETIKERIGSRGDELYSVYQILRAHQRYDLILTSKDEFKFDIIFVNTDRNSIEETANQIINELTEKGRI